MEQPHILVVDDEREIADLLETCLLNEGYRVSKAYHGNAAKTIIDCADIDLAILDIMMPETDGLTLCRYIREKHNYPVIMLTAKTEDIDIIIGLSQGADDYITKPFNPLELIARVKAQLRRFLILREKGNIPDDTITIRSLSINKNTCRVTLDSRELVLTPTEYNILLFLAENKGKVMSSEEIFTEIWQTEYMDSNNAVMVHIRHLREKMQEPSRNPRYIKTVWGFGYKLE
ncbi:MAG: response regulator transcription factor [Bacillota bacterium]|jgi:two-component system response regulator VanR